MIFMQGMYVAGTYMSNDDFVFHHYYTYSYIYSSPGFSCYSTTTIEAIMIM